MDLTIKQLRQVKEILDAANWAGCCSHPDRLNEEDAEKAYRYLQSQQFSLHAIEEYTDKLDVADVYEICDFNVDQVPATVASMIADSIGMDRIRKYLYDPKKKPGNRWHLPESFVLSIH